MKYNKLATLIPVYNPGNKLRKTLLALSAMEHGHIIIVNDGGEEDITYLREEIGIDFTLINLPFNVGITKALNAGLRYCINKGYDLLARIDAGDIPINDRFSKQVKYLSDNPDCSLVGCQVKVINDSGGLEFFYKNSTSGKDLKNAMFTRNAFFHCSVMFRLSTIKEVGYYDESYILAQDYELFFRISRKYNVGLIDEILMLDLYNPDGLSYSRRNEQLRAKLRAQIRYFSPSNINSYVGIIKSLLIISLPDKLIWEAKKIIRNRKWRKQRRK